MKKEFNESEEVLALLLMHDKVPYHFAPATKCSEEFIFGIEKRCSPASPNSAVGLSALQHVQYQIVLHAD